MPASRSARSRRSTTRTTSPSEWKDYYKANVEFFDDLGSPGGAAKLGVIPKDHPLIAALPPQDALTREPGRLALDLPDFPWDPLAPYASGPARTPAASSTSRSARPVDPTPDVVRDALAAPPTPPATRRPAARRPCARPSPPGSPGAAASRASTRTACCRRSAPRSWSPGCRPCSGSGPATSSCIPERRLPDVRRRRAARRRDAGAADDRGARAVASRGRRARLAQLAGNPTGRVLRVEHLAKVVRLGPRSTASSSPATSATPSSAGTAPGEPVARAPGPARLRRQPRRACSRSTRCPSSPTSPATGRRSSPATPRWCAGCSRSASTPGMIVPGRCRQAMVAALGDDEHVAEQRERYGRRRKVLRPALEAAGFRVDHSEAGLYLWATRGEDGWDDVGAPRRAGHPGRARQLLRRGRRAARPRGADGDRRADRGRPRSG